MNKSNDCLFCRIVKGEIPSKKIFEDTDTIAFHDINPKAPVHILVIPREHHEGVHEIPEGRMDIIQHLFAAVTRVINQEKLAGSGYRLVINFGKQGGQAVPHIHVHVLSGRDMHWPPG